MAEDDYICSKCKKKMKKKVDLKDYEMVSWRNW